jgi:hypothetical protein
VHKAVAVFQSAKGRSLANTLRPTSKLLVNCSISERAIVVFKGFDLQSCPMAQGLHPIFCSISFLYGNLTVTTTILSYFDCSIWVILRFRAEFPSTISQSCAPS